MQRVARPRVPRAILASQAAVADDGGIAGLEQRWNRQGRAEGLPVRGDAAGGSREIGSVLQVAQVGVVVGVVGRPGRVG